MPHAHMPAVSLIGVPGRVRPILDLASEIERRGFSGIYCPSLGDGLGLCHALALTTKHVRFGTAIVNIYTRHVRDYAQSAALVHELSGGRFLFGVGVSHAPVNQYLGVKAGSPLVDMREFVGSLRAAAGDTELPPLVLATLRDPMVRLAGELAEGAVFANGARSYTTHSLDVLPKDRAYDEAFFFGNMIPTCICDDVEAAAARNRRTMLFYLGLANYRDYWKKAGYAEEMEAIEQALEAGDKERIPNLISERWLSDCTLYGTASQVREGIEAWFDAGLRTPIIVPSSATGNQLKAFEELFAAYV